MHRGWSNFNQIPCWNLRDTDKAFNYMSWTTQINLDVNLGDCRPESEQTPVGDIVSQTSLFQLTNMERIGSRMDGRDRASQSIRRPWSGSC